MTAKTMTFEVYGNEDIQLSGEEFAYLVEFEVTNIDGVSTVSIGNSFGSPPEVVVDVTAETTVVSEEELEFELSTLELVHNAVLVS